jgi:hypothetical protein
MTQRSQSSDMKFWEDIKTARTIPHIVTILTAQCLSSVPSLLELCALCVPIRLRHPCPSVKSVVKNSSPILSCLFVCLFLHPPAGHPIQSPSTSFRATLISATTSALPRSAVGKTPSSSFAPLRALSG